MLEQPKDSSINGASPGIRDRKLLVEVFPVKMSATLQGHSLTLSGPDDASQLTIDLLGCTVAAVSASNLPSRKWLVQIVAGLFNIHLSLLIVVVFLPSATKRDLLGVCIIMLLAAIWILDLLHNTIPRFDTLLLYKKSESNNCSRLLKLIIQFG
jgi:hypothetical protein